MTLRQQILQLVYPVFTFFKKISGSAILENIHQKKGDVPFHSLSVQLNNGKEFLFDALRGKKVMLVNTASDCGFTSQYKELQKLYSIAAQHLVIIGFPSNDFREQEKGNDEQIAAFCQDNFGITFPISRKSIVTKKNKQHPVYEWLSDKKKNGWNDRQPSWNFSKYLVDETGILTHYFDPAVSPLSSEILNVVNKKNSSAG